MNRQFPTRILVVDDDHDAAWTLASLLKMQLACDVRTAFDGAQAVDRASEFRPQAVVMDIAMPGIDGIEAVGVLRRLFNAAEQPLLIALTGLARDDHRQRILGGGFDVCLYKPVDLEALLEALRRKPAGA